jgi:hypothetical protein
VGALEEFYGLLPSPPRDPFIFFVWKSFRPIRLRRSVTPRSRRCAATAH